MCNGHGAAAGVHSEGTLTSNISKLDSEILSLPMHVKRYKRKVRLRAHPCDVRGHALHTRGGGRKGSHAGGGEVVAAAKSCSTGPVTLTYRMSRKNPPNPLLSHDPSG